MQNQPDDPTFTGNDHVQDQPITFLFVQPEEDNASFVMMRSVGEYVTHWLAPYGAWVGFPEDVPIDEFVTTLVETDQCPKLHAFHMGDMDDD